MLARSPADLDNLWPQVTIRNVIERLNNRLIEEQIEIGVLNARGETLRNLDEGGRQERDLATKFKTLSDGFIAQWPRTAAILRSIAESYEHRAKREDIDSDLNDLRW
jgi:hypothetical protein